MLPILINYKVIHVSHKVPGAWCHGSQQVPSAWYHSSQEVPGAMVANGSQEVLGAMVANRCLVPWQPGGAWCMVPGAMAATRCLVPWQPTGAWCMVPDDMAANRCLVHGAWCLVPWQPGGAWCIAPLKQLCISHIQYIEGVIKRARKASNLIKKFALVNASENVHKQITVGMKEK